MRRTVGTGRSLVGPATIAIPAVVLLLYASLFVRGLGWQWQSIVRPPGVLPAPLSAPPVEAVSGSGAARPDAPAAAGAAAPAAPAAPAAGAKRPLPPSDAPAPRDTVDERGVYYDPQGVAVRGIDADPTGVYNVPPGRQVRIGGASGTLYDVLPDGKLSPATEVKQGLPN
jgi:hypothetical protein